MGVDPSQIFAGPPSLPRSLPERRGWLPRMDKRVRGTFNPPRPNHQSSSCPSAFPADHGLLLPLSASRQTAWEMEEEAEGRRARRVTASAVQSLGQRVCVGVHAYLALYHLFPFVCVCVCVIENFFLFLRTRQAPKNVSVCKYICA